MEKFEFPVFEIWAVSGDVVVTSGGIDTEPESLVKEPGTSKINLPIDWLL